MNYSIIKKMPNISLIKQALPLSSVLTQQVAQDRLEIKKILQDEDKRLLLIVGPCSAWPESAVLEYAHRLQNLNARLKSTFKLVMRVYTQKPRTTNGWTGLAIQPNPFEPADIELGVRRARQLMIDVLGMGLAIADEALFSFTQNAFNDLLAWVAVGARSSENQEHRIYASSLDYPVGIKNPTHGSLAVAINSLVVAQHSHPAICGENQIMTQGNPFAHLVLRGSPEAPNYSVEALEQVQRLMHDKNIQNPAVIIDVSHDNCLVNGQRQAKLQPELMFQILKNVETKPSLRKMLKGFMIESFLKEGTQKFNLDKPELIDYSGLSITDPCLSWEQTEEALLRLSDAMKL